MGDIALTEGDVTADGHYQELSNLMPASQSPNCYRVGSVDEAFDCQAPFSI